MFTYLRLAERDGGPDALAKVRLCAERMRGIVDVARDFARADGEPQAFDLSLAAESAATRLRDAVEIDLALGEPHPAAVPAAAGAFLVAAVLRGVAGGAAAPRRVPVAIDAAPGRVLLRVGFDGAVDGARPVDALAPSRLSFDLWLAALIAEAAGGTLRVAAHGDELAVEVDLPAAEAP